MLDLAGVSRSTFYTHYRDKDDLFLSDVEDFFEHMANLLSTRGEVSQRVAPVRELFAHIAEQREFYAALIAAGKINDVLELAQGHFARAIERRFAAGPATSAHTTVPRAALAHALAGALLALLTWWIDHDMPASPAQMDDSFPLPRGRHHFFPKRSFSAALSSMESASSRFNRVFSSSSALSRLASETSKPPNLAFHL